MALDTPREGISTAKVAVVDDPTRQRAVPVEERPPDPATVLRRLRVLYPHWGFVYDQRGCWTALSGDQETGVTIQRPDPLALRLAVEETMRGRR